MAPEQRYSEEYELLRRTSFSSSQTSEPAIYYPMLRQHAFRNILLKAWTAIISCLERTHAREFMKTCSLRRRRRCCLLARDILASVLVFLTFVIAITIIFRPSYTHLPKHYKALKKNCMGSSKPGRGNVNSEKVFIAAALYDPGGTLVGGDWGDAILQLVDLLGPDNVHVSIYENDADLYANASLSKLERKLNCNTSFISEYLDYEVIPWVIIPTGGRRMKRIAFLAEVRNKALNSLSAKPQIRYDKILFVNDVIFNPIDAVQLLFSTNIDSSGRSQYGAACALDFINAFKFYDRFATRDFDGYVTGVPFFPWFTNAGSGISRQDVMDQKDAVRVRACWGGMTAFEAKWFQEDSTEIVQSTKSPANFSPTLNLSPLRFRYEEDPFWDASECCLIHADLTYLRHGLNTSTNTGIYTNPYVRVAYDSRTLSWLSVTRRAERLYPFVHNIINHLAHLPYANTRRLELPGDEVIEKVWVWDTVKTVTSGEIDVMPTGSYHDVKRIAPPGRFCGVRLLLVLNEDAQPGDKKWSSIPLPPILD